MSDKSASVLLGEAGALLACWALALPHSDDDLQADDSASILQASMAAIATLLGALDDAVSEPPHLVKEIGQASALARMIEHALWRFVTAASPLGEQASAGDLRNACNRVRDHVWAAADALAVLQVTAPNAIALDKARARRPRGGARS